MRTLPRTTAPRRAQARYHRQRQRALRAGHRCLWCGRRSVAHVLCAACREGRVVAYHARRAQGLCVDCGAEAGGAWACESCQERRNAGKRARRGGRR